MHSQDRNTTESRYFQVLDETQSLPWRCSACKGVRCHQGQGFLFLGQQLPSQVDDPFILLIGLGERIGNINVRCCWACYGVLLVLKNSHGLWGEITTDSGSKQCVAGNRSHGIQHPEVYTKTFCHLQGAGRASLSLSHLEIVPKGTDTTKGVQITKAE